MLLISWGSFVFTPFGKTKCKGREYCREAFDGFEAESIANFTEKRIASISSQLNMDVLKVRGVVDNSKRLIEVITIFLPPPIMS